MSALVDVNTLTVEQMTALVAQLEAKKQEAEARQRAEEDAKRREEEARRKAAEKKRLAEAEERKRVEGDKKKTGAESSVQCAACIKANAECTFSAASIRVTSCDRCRATKSACTLSGKAEKPKRKKRADTEEEEEAAEAESSCGDKKRRRRRNLMEAEDEVDERGLVVAALEVLADRIGQVSEELASNRKVQQKMVTVLDNIFRALESRKEEVDTSVKFE